MTVRTPCKSHLFRTTAAATMSVALLLQGCTAVQDIQSSMQFDPARYRDPSDQCSPFREPLISSKEKFLEPILIGAGAGAVAGGVLGGVIADDNPLLGVVLGGLAGALAGATVGYLNAKQTEGATQAEVLAAIDRDANASTAQLGTIGGALQQLNACRSKQIQAVERGVKDKTMTGEQAKKQLASIRTALSWDKELVDIILGEVNKANAVYVDAVAQTREVDRKVVAGEALAYEPAVAGAAGTLYTKSGSNVRAAPSTDAARLGALPAGSAVQVLGDAAGGAWKQVRYKGQVAYIFASLLGTRDEVKGVQTASLGDLPQVDRTARPKSDDAVQELILVSAETRTEYDAQYDSLEGDLDALEILVQ